jgi:hypothetical protein
MTLDILLRTAEHAASRMLRAWRTCLPTLLEWDADAVRETREPLSVLLARATEPATAPYAALWPALAVARRAETARARTWLQLGRRLASYHAARPAVVLLAAHNGRRQWVARRLLTARCAAALGPALPEDAVIDPQPPYQR